MKFITSPINGEVINYGSVDQIHSLSNYSKISKSSNRKFYYLSIYQPREANKIIVAPTYGKITDIYFLHETEYVPTNNLYRSQKEENRLTITIKNESLEVIITIFFGGNKWVTPSVSLVRDMKGKDVFKGQKIGELEFHSYGEVYIKNSGIRSVEWLVDRSQEIKINDKLIEVQLDNNDPSDIKNILLTVPHSKSLDGETGEHIVDIIALDMAKYFKDKLNEHSDDFNVQLVPADINRTICDENRYECMLGYGRDLNLNVQLNIFLDKGMENSYILDIHSYDDPKWWNKNADYKFVILDGYWGLTGKRSPFISKLVNYLVKNYFHNNRDIGHLKGGENYIINYSMLKTKYKVIACLFEFYETNSEEYNREIIDKIVEFLLQYR